MSGIKLKADRKRNVHFRLIFSQKGLSHSAQFYRFFWMYEDDFYIKFARHSQQNSKPTMVYDTVHLTNPPTYVNFGLRRHNPTNRVVRFAYEVEPMAIDIYVVIYFIYIYGWACHQTPYITIVGCWKCITCMRSAGCIQRRMSFNNSHASNTMHWYLAVSCRRSSHSHVESHSSLLAPTTEKVLFSSFTFIIHLLHICVRFIPISAHYMSQSQLSQYPPHRPTCMQFLEAQQYPQWSNRHCPAVGVGCLHAGKLLFRIVSFDRVHYGPALCIQCMIIEDTHVCISALKTTFRTISTSWYTVSQNDRIQNEVRKWQDEFQITYRISAMRGLSSVATFSTSTLTLYTGVGEVWNSFVSF